MAALRIARPTPGVEGWSQRQTKQVKQKSELPQGKQRAAA
jgi:hypothetical protein